MRLEIQLPSLHYGVVSLRLLRRGQIQKYGIRSILKPWLPYQLAEPSDVSIAIYAADGRLVRRLELGHQAAGVYKSRSHAAYWDGKNELGESVASGVYFYTLMAGEFTATRKMLIMK